MVITSNAEEEEDFHSGSHLYEGAKTVVIVKCEREVWQ